MKTSFQNIIVTLFCVAVLFVIVEMIYRYEHRNTDVQIFRRVEIQSNGLFNSENISIRPRTNIGHRTKDSVLQERNGCVPPNIPPEWCIVSVSNYYIAQRRILDFASVSDAKGEMASRETLGLATKELRKVLGLDGYEQFIKWNKHEGARRGLD